LLVRAREVQHRQLLAILQHNAGTVVGRRHGFGGVRDYAEYRERVPVAAYDDVRSDIEGAASGRTNLLTRDAPVAFEETGGSGGGRKLVPYTTAALDAFGGALLPWLDDLAAHYPPIIGGKAYWAISPVARAPRITAGGTPIGLNGDAAYFGDALAPLVQKTLAVPPAVGVLQDIDAWREATCAHLLACEQLALISVWSPVFLLNLLDFMRAHAEPLIARMRAGAFDGVRITDARAALVREQLHAAQPDYRLLWPQLQVVSCWDQAASRPCADLLRTQLGAIALQGKGLLATEGAVSVPLCWLKMPVLAVASGFFEFCDSAGVCHDTAGVAAGGEYDVVMTTWSGFYRYAIGDRVRVHGFEGEAPLLEFIGRGSMTSDLCGEKLSEDFVLGALAPLGLRFALLAPAVRRGYALFVDIAEVPASAVRDYAARTDVALCANPQYAYARTLGQLAPVEIRRCVRPQETWQRDAVGRGMRLGDIKPPALSPRHGWEQQFQFAAP
jgi:hypothetical protein